MSKKHSKLKPHTTCMSLQIKPHPLPPLQINHSSTTSIEQQFEEFSLKNRYRQQKSFFFDCFKSIKQNERSWVVLHLRFVSFWMWLYFLWKERLLMCDDGASLKACVLIKLVVLVEQTKILKYGRRCWCCLKKQVGT